MNDGEVHSLAIQLTRMSEHQKSTDEKIDKAEVAREKDRADRVKFEDETRAALSQIYTDVHASFLPKNPWQPALMVLFGGIIAVSVGSTIGLLVNEAIKKWMM